MTVQKQTLMKTRSQMTCLVNKRMEDSESLENRIIEMRSCDNLVEIFAIANRWYGRALPNAGLN